MPCERSLRVRLKTHIRLFTLMLCLFIATAYASAQECLSYDVAGVQLTGTISRKTFPGPPNYESIRRGDKPETYWILHLARPICTTANADDEAESGITDLQLILPLNPPPKDYARFKKLAGRKDVMVVGQLMHAISGHHHTPVLVEVKGVGVDRPFQF
jgi:hypothetical protein